MTEERIKEYEKLQEDRLIKEYAVYQVLVKELQRVPMKPISAESETQLLTIGKILSKHPLFRGDLEDQGYALSLIMNKIFPGSSAPIENRSQDYIQKIR